MTGSADLLGSRRCALSDTVYAVRGYGADCPRIRSGLPQRICVLASRRCEALEMAAGRALLRVLNSSAKNLTEHAPRGFAELRAIAAAGAAQARRRAHSRALSHALSHADSHALSHALSHAVDAERACATGHRPRIAVTHE